MLCGFGDVRVRRTRIAGLAQLSWAALLLAASASEAQTSPDSQDDCGSLCFLDAHNQPLDVKRAALQVSTFITNGPTLPRGNVATA